MLNQPFKNKIGLHKNANLHKNIYYENAKIKKVFKSEHIRPSTKK